jgi:hypothetical protein
MLRQELIMRQNLKALGLAGFGGMALLLAGCASDPGSLQPGNSASDKLANLLAFNTANPPPVVATKEIVKVDCPTIEVQDGTAAARYYAGAASNENVRYQFSLGDVARECSVENNKIFIKVGVSGRALLGPVGSPGTYSAPVRIAIRQETDGKPIVSKLYKATAVITSGEAGEATFSFVSDALEVPMLREQADQDYTILVGFDTGAKSDAPVKKRRRK